MHSSSEVICRWGSSSGSISHIPTDVQRVAAIFLVAWSWCWSSQIVPTLSWGGMRSSDLCLEPFSHPFREAFFGLTDCEEGSALAGAEVCKGAFTALSWAFPWIWPGIFILFPDLSQPQSPPWEQDRLAGSVKWPLLHPRQSPRNHSSCGPPSHLSLFPFFLLISSLLCLPPPHFFCLCFFFYPVPSWSPSACVSQSLSLALSLSGDRSSGLVAICCRGCFLCECVRVCARAGARGAFFMRLRSDGI